MVRVVQTGKDEYNCPKKCGPLKYGRSFHIFKKTTHCKKCNGMMLTDNDVKEWEKNSAGLRQNKLRKNNLFELLKSGINGTLDCPKCSKRMKEIHLKYKKTRIMSRQEDVMKDPGKYVIEFIPFIGNLIRMVQATVDLAGDLTQSKLEKSVTIDGCDACLTFWLDQGEIIQITGNDLTIK